MNPPETPDRDRKQRFSAEAIVGAGMTVAMIGLLFLMLGWAQHLREVKEGVWILLALGGVLVVAGGLTAGAARAGNKR